MAGDFSQLVAIPWHEYAQLTAVQNARQPITEHFYKLEDEYQRNALITDPQRSIALQSQTIEHMKNLKDQMRNHLSITTPKPYRSRADSLLQSLSSQLKVNETGELVKDDGTAIPSSRFEDLIQHAVRDRRRKFTPEGWDYFLHLLKLHNVPRSLLNRETLDELTKVGTSSPTTESAIKKKSHITFHLPAATSSPLTSTSILSTPPPGPPPSPSSIVRKGKRKRSQSLSPPPEFKLSPSDATFVYGSETKQKRRRVPPDRFLLRDYE